MTNQIFERIKQTAYKHFFLSNTTKSTYFIGIIGFMSQVHLLTPAFRLGTKYELFLGFSPEYSN